MKYKGEFLYKVFQSTPPVKGGDISGAAGWLADQVFQSTPP